ncbi:MAG: hypothetical protein WAU39_14420, partial [Polyangiales bacterium]
MTISVQLTLGLPVFTLNTLIQSSFSEAWLALSHCRSVFADAKVLTLAGSGSGMGSETSGVRNY